MAKKNLDINIYADLEKLRRLQYQAKGFSFSPNQPVNSLLSGKYSSRLRGRGLNFEELRHYRPGDDIRSMDWKVTRRTGKPHVKVYTEERERNVFLVIDQRMGMFFGSTHKMKSVIAAELAALIAWRITDSGDRLGAVIYNDTETTIVPAKRGKQHVVHVLTELIVKNHQLKIDQESQDESQSLNQVLMKLTKIAGNNSLVILIGDGHGWNEQSTDYIKNLRRHNELIACHVFDPLELELPEITHMVVSNGLEQIQVASQDPSMRKSYQDEAKIQMQNYSSLAKKYRIPFLPIDTTSPVEQQLRKLLGQVPK